MEWARTLVSEPTSCDLTLAANTRDPDDCSYCRSLHLGAWRVWEDANDFPSTNGRAVNWRDPTTGPFTNAGPRCLKSHMQDVQGAACERPRMLPFELQFAPCSLPCTCNLAILPFVGSAPPLWLIRAMPCVLPLHPSTRGETCIPHASLQQERKRVSCHLRRLPATSDMETERSAASCERFCEPRSSHGSTTVL